MRLPWQRRARGVVLRVVPGDPMPPEVRVTRDLCDERFEHLPAPRLERLIAERVDFSDLHFTVFRAVECRFVDCDFSGVSVDWLPFGGARCTFQRCSFHGARISDFGDARLEGCDFSDADLSGWFTWHNDIVECRFAGRLQDVVFEQTDAGGEHRNAFHGNDFRDAELIDVAFRGGIDLDAQLLPSSPAYLRLRDVNERLRAARRQVERWPDRDARERGLSALDDLSFVWSDEQDVFTLRDSLIEYAGDDDVTRRVLALLEPS